jgi:hypothetical protein
MTKATVETLKLILIIALGLLILMYFIPIATNELDSVCKNAQMDELNKVWEQLDNFEKNNQTIQPGSYNTIQDFHVQSCTSEIKYVPVENGRGYLTIKWKSSGYVQKIPTEASWTMEDDTGPPMDLTEGTTWDMKVSLGNVAAIHPLREL